MIDFGPRDIMRILGVTDDLGIHREAVRIPLQNEGSGAVRLASPTLIEIVAPAEGDLEAWIAGLPDQIRALDLSAVPKAES